MVTQDKPAVKNIAERLNIERAKEAHKYACAFCGSSDAFHVYPEADRGFYCFSCGKSGDSIDLYRQAAGVDFVTACKDLGVELETGKRGKKGRLRRQKSVKNHALSQTGRNREKPGPDEKVKHRPESEVLEVWRSCGDVYNDKQVRDYLRGRGINSGAVVDLDLARVVPESLPVWCRCNGVSWHESGHHLVFPLFDASGKMRSLVARDITGTQIKSLSAHGPRKHLVFANPTALDVLRGKILPAFDVFITEGEIDFCTLAVDYGPDAGLVASDRPIILGTVGGSWSWLLTSRIDSARVTLLMDYDKSGADYKQKIERYIRS